MGREIRRVPPNWQHPENHRGFIPLYDENYEVALEKWIEDRKLWLANSHPVQVEHRQKIEGGKKYDHERLDRADYYDPKTYAFEDYSGNAPTPEDRRNFRDDEATWFQLYETVSEGTPVSPPFETQEELALYLGENGDFWDQKRRKEGGSSMPCGPWGIEKARKFVLGGGYAPSMVVQNGRVMDGVTAMVEMASPSPTNKSVSEGAK